MTLPDFLTLADVSKLLRVSKPTVRKAVQQQGLPALRLRLEDLERWENALAIVEFWSKEAA